MAENGSDFIVDDGISVFFDGFDPASEAEDVFLDAAIEILAYAKENAPWADRTGNARAGLDVEVDSEGGELSLTLFHTVDYGQWLETIQGGEFATIMPTLETFAPEVFERAGGRIVTRSGGE